MSTTLSNEVRQLVNVKNIWTGHTQIFAARGYQAVRRDQVCMLQKGDWKNYSHFLNHKQPIWTPRVDILFQRSHKNMDL